MSRKEFEERAGASVFTDDVREGGPLKREPVFNMPGVILLLIVAFAGIHAVRTLFLGDVANTNLILLFSFIPAAYGDLANQFPFPMAAYWSPVTYGFLHGNWGHVAMNSIWMVAFGSPVAKRFGTARFLIFTAVCMCAGALAHYLAFAGQFVPVIGASGAVSGYMGAAGRFAFNNMGRGNKRGLRADGPALSLWQSFTNRQFLVFAGVWLVFNYLFGSGIVLPDDGGAGIAWQAHVGGFAAGVLLFSLFDPVNKVRS